MHCTSNNARPQHDTCVLSRHSALVAPRSMAAPQKRESQHLAQRRAPHETSLKTSAQDAPWCDQIPRTLSDCWKSNSSPPRTITRRASPVHSDPSQQHWTCLTHDSSRECCPILQPLVWSWRPLSTRRRIQNARPLRAVPLINFPCSLLTSSAAESTDGYRHPRASSAPRGSSSAASRSNRAPAPSRGRAT